jgi:hypothetical protein
MIEADNKWQHLKCSHNGQQGLAEQCGKRQCARQCPPVETKAVAWHCMQMENLEEKGMNAQICTDMILKHGPEVIE